MVCILWKLCSHTAVELFDLFFFGMQYDMFVHNLKWKLRLFKKKIKTLLASPAAIIGVAYSTDKIFVLP